MIIIIIIIFSFILLLCKYSYRKSNYTDNTDITTKKITNNTIEIKSGPITHIIRFENLEVGKVYKFSSMVFNENDDRPNELLGTLIHTIKIDNPNMDYHIIDSYVPNIEYENGNTYYIKDSVEEILEEDL